MIYRPSEEQSANFDYGKNSEFSGVMAQHVWREIKEALKEKPLTKKQLAEKVTGYAPGFLAWVLEQAEKYDVLAVNGEQALVLK